MQTEQNDPCKTDWGLQELHQTMLRILLYVDEFCQENGIDYCLAYGSALGAKRHKGFIPWDDDADIYMTAEGYQAFRRLFAEKGDRERFYLQEMGAVDGMVTVAKLRMNGTTLIEPLYEPYDIHQGIYIDIFVLFDAPMSRFSRVKMLRANQYLLLKGLSNRHYRAGFAVNMLLGFLRLFPRNAFRKTAMKILYGQSKGGKQYFDVDLRTYERSFFDKDMIFPAVRTEFCGQLLPVPKEIDAYLTHNYGDYMRMPSVESIRHAQHAGIWKTDEDFRNYAPNIDSYKDEK